MPSKSSNRMKDQGRRAFACALHMAGFAVLVLIAVGPSKTVQLFWRGCSTESDALACPLYLVCPHCSSLSLNKVLSSGNQMSRQPRQHFCAPPCASNNVSSCTSAESSSCRPEMNACNVWFCPQGLEYSIVVPSNSSLSFLFAVLSDKSDQHQQAFSPFSTS